MNFYARKTTKASFIYKEGLKDVLWMIHRFFRK